MTTGNTMSDDTKALIERLESFASEHEFWSSSVECENQAEVEQQVRDIRDAIAALSAQPSPDAAQQGAIPVGWYKRFARAPRDSLVPYGTFLPEDAAAAGWQPVGIIPSAPESAQEGPAGEAYWWCPECKEEVDGGRVTFSENHDSCGARVIEKFAHPAPQSPAKCASPPGFCDECESFDCVCDTPAKDEAGEVVVPEALAQQWDEKYFTVKTVRVTRQQFIAQEDIAWDRQHRAQPTGAAEVDDAHDFVLTPDAQFFGADNNGAISVHVGIGDGGFSLGGDKDALRSLANMILHTVDDDCPQCRAEVAAAKQQAQGEQELQAWFDDSAYEAGSCGDTEPVVTLGQLRELFAGKRLVPVDQSGSAEAETLRQLKHIAAFVGIAARDNPLQPIGFVMEKAMEAIPDCAVAGEKGNADG